MGRGGWGELAESVLGQLPEAEAVEQSGERGQSCVGHQILGCGHGWELELGERPV